MSPSDQHHDLLAVARDVLLAGGHININEPERPTDKRDRQFLRTTLEDGTPALIYWSGRHRDEWTVGMALWPSPDGEKHLPAFPTGPESGRTRPGEVVVRGWLNRWQRDGRAIGIERFHHARAYVARSRKIAVAALLANHASAS